MTNTDARATDRVIVEYVTGGSHYDYRSQYWMDGHDHYHVVNGERLFCGADIETCQGAAVDRIYDREHTTCGHPVPAHHETTWGTDGDVFCSLACMAARS